MAAENAIQIAWLDRVLDLFEQQSSQGEEDQAYNWLEMVATWSVRCDFRWDLYRHHRWFLAERWIVFYGFSGFGSPLQGFAALL